MTVAKLVEAMGEIAPTRYAEPWDNVGLIVGDRAAPATRVLLCIDLTLPVLAEAASLRCDAVVAYHPPVFEGLKRFLAGEVAFEAARRGIAVYSPHTALDVAPGGTNDVLAEALGLTDLRPLRASEGKATQCKLVTFVPADHADVVADALFAAGAGRIGRYERCSFRSQGEGTFQGGENTNPAVGSAGKFERVAEVRVEMVVPLKSVEVVVAALRAAHPYEEPAFDLAALLAVPEGVGIGRVGTVRETTLGELAEKAKRALGLRGVMMAGDPAARVSRVALCAGAGRSLIGDVLSAGAHCYVTGELPHHDALRLARSGVGALCTLHSNSERGVLSALRGRLAEAGFECVISGADRDPFEWV